MFSKRHLLASLACAILFATGAEAQRVFVLPASSGQTALVLGESSFASPGSVVVPNTAFRVFSRPDGNRYWVVSRSETDSLLLLDQSLQVISRRSLGEAVRAATVTPDGRYLLVLTSVLRIYDMNSDSEVIAATPVDVGANAIDLTAAPDSRRVFVLSQGAQRATAVDITNPASPRVAGVVPLPGGEYSAITTGPDGLVYASLTNQIVPIDPDSIAALEPAIGVNGLPGPMLFTPNGVRAIAANRQIVTGSSGFLIDVANRTVTNVPSISQIFEEIAVVSNTRALGRTNGNALYDISISPLSAIPAQVGGTSPIAGVTGIAASNEFPSARFLYVAANNYAYRIDLQTTTVDSGGQFPLQVAGRVAYAAVPGPGPAASIITYNNNQGIQAGGTLRPLAVRVLNSAGKPVSGAPVTFSSGNAGVTIMPVSTTTNAEGLARASVALPAVASNYTVDAASGAIKSTFNLAVGSTSGGGTPTAGGLTVFSGNGQLVPEIAAATTPLTVKVVNPDGTPATIQAVTFEVTAGPITLTPLSTADNTCVGSICTTNSEGKAAISFTTSTILTGRSFDQGLVTARLGDGRSVLFNIVIYQRTAPDGSFVIEPQVELQKPIQGETITGAVGERIPGAVQARVTAGGRADIGMPLQNVGLAVSTGNTDPALGPVAYCDNNPLSSSTGIVICDLVLGGTVGDAPLEISVGAGARVYTGRLRVTVGAPSQIRLIQGNNQTGNAGQKLPLALIVEVDDAAGNPLANVPVQWAVPVAGSAALSNVRNTTDANGRAQAEVTLGGTPGAVPIRVTAGTATATFNLTSNVAITGLSKVSGDNQVAVIGQSFAQPLVVLVTDAQGRPVPGASVSFAVTGGPAIVGSPTAATDAQGRALTTVVAGPAAGAVTVRAALGNLAVSFNLNTRLPGPAVAAADFRNAAGGQSGLTPGGIAIVRGTGILTGIQGLVVANQTAPGPLPTQLRGVEIQFGGVPAPIYWINSSGGTDEVAFQTPFELAPGTTSVTIRSAGGGTSTINDVQVLPVQPGLFETGSAGARYAVATRPDGSWVSPSNPALRGERIRIYLTGLGQTTPAWGTNRAGVPGQAVITAAVAGLNNEGIEPESVEALPGAVGIYVATFQVPANTAPGNAPVGFALRQGEALVFSNGSFLPVQ